jgi:uroporphyrin-III C-methyltransferase
VIQIYFIKGAKALAEANVVLYDAQQMKNYYPMLSKKALKIFVGKRKGSHEYTQEEINQLIVDNALTCSSVKGGDPFIFWSGQAKK